MKITTRIVSHSVAVSIAGVFCYSLIGTGGFSLLSNVASVAEAEELTTTQGVILALEKRLGSGNDKYIGTADPDKIYGGQGDDYLRGALGNDKIFGGPGRDLIRGNPGVDWLYGEGDQDFIRGGDDSDRMNDGGIGDDFIMGNNGNDLIHGREGRDALLGGGDNDTIVGGPGADALSGEDGRDVYQYSSLADIDGDVITYWPGDVFDFRLPQPLTVSTDDAFSGVPYEAIVESGSILTSIYIDAEGDRSANAVLTLEGVTSFDPNLLSAAPAPQPEGGTLGSSDSMWNQVASVLLAIVKRFGSGHDTYVGTASNDSLYGGAGEDALRGAGGNDNVHGGDHGDFLQGNDGGDFLNGQDEVDVLIGGAGDDRLDGGNSHDFLIGGVGNDTLNGGEGSDYLLGELGNDTVIGSAADFVTGGEGADIFYYTTPDSMFGNVITDFQQGTDVIVLSFTFDASFSGATRFSRKAGEVIYETNGRVTGLGVDVNGDGVSDKHLVLLGGHVLTPEDVVILPR